MFIFMHIFQNADFSLVSHMLSLASKIVFLEVTGLFLLILKKIPVEYPSLNKPQFVSLPPNPLPPEKCCSSVCIQSHNLLFKISLELNAL